MFQQRGAISQTLTGTHDRWSQSSPAHLFQLSPIFSGALQQSDTFVGDFLIQLKQIPKKNLFCSIRGPAIVIQIRKFVLQHEPGSGQKSDMGNGSKPSSLRPY